MSIALRCAIVTSHASTFASAGRSGASGRPARYVASGEVPGWLVNQYALSEWQGPLRVATTSGGAERADPDEDVERAAGDGRVALHRQAALVPHLEQAAIVNRRILTWIGA